MEVNARQAAMAESGGRGSIFSTVYVLKSDVDVMSQASAFTPKTEGKKRAKGSTTKKKSAPTEKKKASAEKKLKVDDDYVGNWHSKVDNNLHSLPDGEDDHDEDFVQHFVPPHHLFPPNKGARATRSATGRHDHDEDFVSPQHPNDVGCFSHLGTRGGRTRSASGGRVATPSPDEHKPRYSELEQQVKELKQQMELQGLQYKLQQQQQAAGVINGMAQKATTTAASTAKKDTGNPATAAATAAGNQAPRNPDGTPTTWALNSEIQASLGSQQQQPRYADQQQQPPYAFGRQQQREPSPYAFAQPPFGQQQREPSPYDFGQPLFGQQQQEPSPYDFGQPLFGQQQQQPRYADQQQQPPYAFGRQQQREPSPYASPFGSQQQQSALRDRLDSISVHHKPTTFHLNSSNPQFVQQLGTLQQAEMQTLQQELRVMKQQQQQPENDYDAKATELATELTTEIRLKRQYADRDQQRNMEDKMIKMTELQKMSFDLKRARYQSP